MLENLSFYNAIGISKIKHQALETKKYYPFIAQKIYDKTITKLHVQAIKKHDYEKKQKRILIVDDEPDVNLLFKIVLEDNNFTVDSFNDPVVALENFKANFYDMVILDIKMPNMNGFDLYEKIRKIDDNVKVCFLTAGEINYKIFKELYPKIQKDDFIIKPIDNEMLIKKVKETLNLD